MLDRLLYKFRAWYLRTRCRSILSTPPIKTTNDPLVFVSLCQHKDVIPYLIAIKTVFQSFGKGAVVLVDDGSLTAKDHATLQDHIQGIDIRPISSVPLNGLQSGGCWERLVTLVEESQKKFAIQVDADLVATGQMKQVIHCWQNNQSFALANTKSPGKLRFSETRGYLEEAGMDHLPHVQIKSELALADLENASERFYRRTTAAFTGLAPGTASLEKLKRFSNEIEAVIGQTKWSEWGSEQVASNYLVASSPDNIELGAPEYVNNSPLTSLSSAQLIHFFGTYRYYGNRYLKYALEAIDRLNKKGA